MKRYIIRSSRLIIASALLVSQLALQNTFSQSSSNWEYSIEFYGMGSSIDGTASVGRVQGVPVNLGFGDILENLEFAGMAHFEAINSDKKIGYMFDYGFMNLSLGGSGQRGIVNADVHQGIFEAAFIKRVVEKGYEVDYYVGLRWWNNDIDVVLDPIIRPGSVRPVVENDWIDIFVGARSRIPLSDRWDFIYQADIGGLDVESNLTYSGSAGFHWKISENLVLDLKYKGLWVDYEEGSPGGSDYFRYDTVTHGPIIGIIKKF